MILSYTSLQAQFIDPTTTDIYISCKSSDVQNTGTSIMGDWQVSVIDGDNPSIVFYNHLTNTEDCHQLEGARQGWRVTDPDVVWDYTSLEDIYVVYVAQSSGFDGIWVERWKMDPFNSFIYLDALYIGSGGVNGLARLSNSPTAQNPNIDFGTRNGNNGVIWEDGGAINVVSNIRNAGAITPIYQVNSFCTGYIAKGYEPDIAIGIHDTISMTYKQLFGTNNRIVVRQDNSGNINAGTANSNCINFTMSIPFNHTDVGFPRISMPQGNIANPADVHPQDCNVTYEVKDISRNYIGTSTRREYLYELYTTNSPPCDPNVVRTSLTNPWTHDIVNTFGIGLANMNADISADINDRPVSAYAADLIYNSWSWNNRTGIRFNLGEVLAVGLNNATSINTTPFTNTPPFGCDTTYTFITRTLTNWNDYSVVGEVWNHNNDQNIVSIGSDSSSFAFAFYEAATSELVIKKANTGTPILRGAKPVEELIFQAEKPKTKIYPNPSNGVVTIEVEEEVMEIVLSDLSGRKVSAHQYFLSPYSVELHLPSSGLYFAKYKLANGNWYTAKLVVK